MDGMAKDRFDRIEDTLAAHVAAGRLPGAVFLVRRRADVHVGTVGTLAIGGTEPMRRDTIFQLASLTKVATAVAALILVEECRIRLDEPIDRLVPELAAPKVIRDRDSELDDTVPAHRAITVRDLLTFRMGTGLDFGFAGTPIGEAVADFHGYPDRGGRSANQFVADLGAVPLLAQPGERWLYNTGSDVLGVLVERAVGQPFAEFLHERVLAPLGMRDTGFAVPAEHLHRVAHGYLADHVTGELRAGAGPTALRRTPARPSPSGGLVGTVDDWFALTEMLRNAGRYPGGRMLAPMTVAAMLSDQLPEAVKARSGFLPGWFDSRGWGLGIGVGTRRDGMEAPGRYGWDGGSGTSWYTDPAADLTAILLTQRGQFPLMSPVYLDFWASVHQALE
jgi:CubicO group peptidase (beta-lactamase class C family)